MKLIVGLLLACLVFSAFFIDGLEAQRDPDDRGRGRGRRGRNRGGEGGRGRGRDRDRGGRGRRRGRGNGGEGIGNDDDDAVNFPGGGNGNSRGNGFPALSQRTVDKIKSDLAPIITGTGTAHALRIGFHDCVGDMKTIRPKCDGCVNRANRQNKGAMLGTLKKMDNLYEKRYSRVLSRADFYALCTVTAVENAIDFNNQECNNGNSGPDCVIIRDPDIEFRFGRTDCPTSPNEPEVIGHPSGLLNFTGTIGFFRDQFNMDERESTAVMGAHTLGGAAESGFLGFWKGDFEEGKKWNNDFYKLLINEPGDIEYVNVDKRFVTAAPRPRWQWDGLRVLPNGRRSTAAFMLNADMCLFKDIQTDSQGRSSCTYDSCPRSRTARIVEEYADDPDSWMIDYSRAHEKFINKGYDPQRELRLPK